MKTAGMTFHSPPVDIGPGLRTVYGRDPDGNVVELQELAADSQMRLPSG